MKSEARLDWAVFQLTPTRTRCDLVISANGKTEKIASGLLNPFLAHLKSAQDQISKGGYSIKLEPDAEINAVWFTKGTVERFVRFVSTPEILERVTTIESEILQIEEAISIQSSDTLNLATADDHQHKSAEAAEVTNGDSDKAIVIYKPGSQPQQTSPNGNNKSQEENSKVQLLKVLETRRNVLRKEQGMAFARAVAAGFDMETLPLLLSFSECFGASRLLKGSSQFMELWKRKHETGQWVEVEAIESMSMRSEIPPFQIPPILLNPEGSENPDGSSKPEHKGMNPHEYYQGQFYPPWPMPYPPPHHYPPYYQNYPYAPPSETHHHSHSRVSKRESDSRSHTGTGTDHESDESDEISVSHKSHHKKNGKKKKKNNQTVVIKNLNYITKKLNGSDSGSESGSGSDRSDSDSTDSGEKSKKHKKSSKKKKNKHATNEDLPRDPRNRDGAVYEDKQLEGDSGNWQAFQSFLLKAEEKSTVNDADMFSSEREPARRRENKRNGTGSGTGTDPFLSSERDYETGQERSFTGGFDSVNGRVSRSRAISSSDEMFMSGERGSSETGLKEIEGGGTYRRTGAGMGEDFMLYGQEKQMVGTNKGYLDPSIEGRYNNSSNNNNNKSYDGNDESFIIASRSGLNDNNFGNERRNTIDIDSELRKNDEVSPPAVKSQQVFYEPEELMNRGFEPVKTDIYDPIVDYEREMHVEKIVRVEEAAQEETVEVKEEGKVEGKDRKVRKSQDGVLDRKRKEALVRRLSGTGTSSRNPLAEAQKRAQNLRSYKADLQKLKKEQEEEQIKRLEALKLERQKRIAARSSSTNPAQSKTKASPNSTQKPSKFTDSDPNSTPVRKSATKTTPSKSNGSGNGLTRSVSSLSDARKERNGSGNPKRLSEPTRSVTAVKKRVVKEEKESSKRVSAILQLDQSKSATLPEIKINVKNEKINVEKEKVGPASESVRAESEVVVEKKVVSVENEVAVVPVSVPVPVREEAEKVEERESKVVGEEREEGREKVEVYEAVRAPPSPVVESSEASHEVIIQHVKEQPKIPQIPQVPQISQNPIVEKPKIAQIPQIPQNPIVEKPKIAQIPQIPQNPTYQIPQMPKNPSIVKPYQAPVARLSSLEPLPESETPPAGSETERTQADVAIDSPDRVHVDHTQELTVVGVEKHKGKGGFRKLLKFGRKKGEGSHAETDVPSADDVAETSNDGHLLKNLISQDDTKVSKSFSLLSPFRRDKKVIYL